MKLTRIRRRLISFLAISILSITVFVIVTSFTISSKNNTSKNDISEELMKFVNSYLKSTDTEQMIAEPIKDSAYVEKETKNELSKEDSKGIEKEIKELKKNLNKDTNKAQPDKDWSIKVDPKLRYVGTEEFVSGNPYTMQFFQDIVNLMYENRLSFPLEQRMKMKNGKTIIDPVVLLSELSDDTSEKVLEGLFHFPDNFIEDATIKHKIITDNLPDIKPNFYKGNGYVIVGGGKYSWFSLLVIETLRKLGSELPIEIFIPSEEDYDEEFCEVVLKPYNARCIYINNVFNSELIKKIKVTGYQYKSLALLASSFENTFLLDSDNYPVINPDKLFSSDLYKQYNMITWPDYWKRTTSPRYYDIIGRKIGKRVRYLDDEYTDVKHFTPNEQTEEYLRNDIGFHDREGTMKEWTTESGQMLINKKVHFKTLLLALYYNLEGQFGYYPLLSQGGAGEGDKESFVAAATFYGLDYYQVHKKPDRAYGFHKWREQLVDTSIIQYDPLRDYQALQFVNRNIDQEIEFMGLRFIYDYFELYQHKFSIQASRPMFYHVHETKLDPFELMKNSATFDLDGYKLRNLGGDFPKFGFDLEQFLWVKVKEHFCEKRTGLKFIAEAEDKDIRALCGKFIKDQIEFLDKTHDVIVQTYDLKKPYEMLNRCTNILGDKPEKKEDGEGENK